MHRLIFEPEHEQFRDSVRRFFKEEVAPQAQRWREQGHVDPVIFRTAGAAGLLCIGMDEIYGGPGICDFRFDQVITEENITFGEPGFYINLHSNLVAPYLAQLGTDEQKARWLPGCVTGEHILAIGMTEPGTGSDLAGIKTKAEDKGDHWLLNGSKTYISNGQIADLVVVAARTDPTSKHGIGLFVVEADTAGFHRGKMLPKIGMHAQDTSELFFTDLNLAKANGLGDPAQGFRYLARFLAQERLVAAIASIAAAQAAFDLTLDFVKQRRAFGKPIGAFQNSRFVLAALRTQIDAVQTFVDQAVLLLNRGALTAEVAAECKLIASELEGRTVDECVQLHGGAGYMEEYRISQYYTDARVTRIFAGSSEIMKEIIGRSLGLDERTLV